MQETKWFGFDIWSIGDRILQDSGNVLSVDGDVVNRRNGVGILINTLAFAVYIWRAAGKVWKAVSPCIVSARHQLDSIWLVDCQSIP